MQRQKKKVKNIAAANSGTKVVLNVSVIKNTKQYEKGY